MARNQYTFKPGETRGRKKKGDVSRCVRVKDDYLRVWQALMGYKGFKKWIATNRQLWPQFFFQVIPGLLPKKTDVAMKMTDLTPREFTPLEAAVRIAFILEKALKRQRQQELQDNAKDKPPQKA